MHGGVLGVRGRPDFSRFDPRPGRSHFSNFGPGSWGGVAPLLERRRCVSKASAIGDPQGRAQRPTLRHTATQVTAHGRQVRAPAYHL